MFILPDFSLLKFAVADHPLMFLVFIFFCGLISSYYLKNIIALNDTLKVCIVFFLIVVSALSHFLLISFILLFYQTIAFQYSGELRLKKHIQILISTLMFLVLLSIAWVCYIKLLIYLDPQIKLSSIEIVRKLYNYPKIYEKIVIPIIELKLFHEAAIVIGSIVMLLFFKTDDEKNKASSFCLLLLLMSFCATGVAKTLYNHIRYFYYLYPIFLFLIAAASVLIWSRLSRNYILRIAFISGLTIFSVLQLYVSWGKVVNASVGSKERFSYSRTYLDHKTCGNYLSKNYARSDYVIAFASAAQTAAYFDGPIHACIKPKLTQYEGREFHYITGSKFFKTKKDLVSVVEENANSDGNIWIFVNQKYKRNGFWGKEFIKKLDDYIVCDASDQYTSLAKVSYQQFINFLRYF